jgi:hypothetical protein
MSSPCRHDCLLGQDSKVRCSAVLAKKNLSRHERLIRNIHPLCHSGCAYRNQKPSTHGGIKPRLPPLPQLTEAKTDKQSVGTFNTNPQSVLPPPLFINAQQLAILQSLATKGQIPPFPFHYQQSNQLYGLSQVPILQNQPSQGIHLNSSPPILQAGADSSNSNNSFPLPNSTDLPNPHQSDTPNSTLQCTLQSQLSYEVQKAALDTNFNLTQTSPILINLTLPIQLFNAPFSPN